VPFPLGASSRTRRTVAAISGTFRRVTVAVLVKVYDGLVLATDSATTLPLLNGASQVYNNANKIFHLHRGLPIGAATFGLGAIQDASIATIAKDLRRRLMGKDPSYPEWELDPTSYSMSQVVDRAIELFYDELYTTAYGASAGAGPGEAAPSAPLGLLVAGYSAQQKQPEAWLLLITGPGVRPVSSLVAATDLMGWKSFAQPQATERLFNAVDPFLLATLKAQLPPAEWSTVQALQQQHVVNPSVASMPFADAIALARFMVDVTIGYSRFALGADEVGGQVEVAGISRHEGFKWIARKHYYSGDINPEEPRHAY
jgi:hypothetical protein